jgi:hypothetical protein
MGRVWLVRIQHENTINLQSHSNQLHRIPPSLLMLSIALTLSLSPFIIIKNGQSETNSTQNNWG